jgi:asparagine synthase (glutamine-hydrolysing)
VFAPRCFSNLSRREAGQRARSILSRSVHERLMSDVPVGALLSGGIDSTAIVGLMREQMCSVPTFSVGYSEQTDVDERAYARRVARHFGTDHHEVSFGEQDALEYLPRLIRHLDDPLADAVSLPIHFVSELAVQHGVKVLLAGEGSDELFWGYPRYEKIVRWWPAVRGIRRAPLSVRRLAARLVAPTSRPRLREFAEGLADHRLPPMHAPAGVPRQLRRLLLCSEQDEYRWNSSAGAGKGTPEFDSLAFDTQEYEFGLRLPERLLMRLDRLSMANGVEARTPFLDHELVELVYRLPPAIKLEGGETKAILRHGLSDVIPSWVLRRRKHGFEVPLSAWLSSRMGKLLRSVMSEDSMRSFFDARGLERLLSQRAAGPDGATACWALLNFGLWHIAWIEGRDIEVLVERAGGGA